MPVNELSELQEGRNVDSGLVLNQHLTAARLIEHPRGHDNSQIRIDLHHDAGTFLPIDSSNDDNVMLKERVEAILDPRRTELVSSVWIRYDTRSRPTSWKPACAYQ